MSEPKPAPRPLEEPAPTGEPRTDALRRLALIVDRLRDPDGCPWDREQTLASVVPHLVEEAHELVEAVETGDDDHAREEAGDVLMGIFLLARIAEQSGRFDLADVAQGVGDKLVRRHPHVFGDRRADSADAAVANWEAIKKKEREARGEEEDASAVAGVPAALPALQRARRIGQKALAAGFRWSSAAGALAKVHEEVGELAEAFEAAGAGTRDASEIEGEVRERLASELGDVLLAAAFLGNYVGIDPEHATREAVRRFERRFRAMEADLGGALEGRPLDAMMAAWQRAKRTTD